MKGGITIRYLQEYIRLKDNHPERKTDYFLKLCEETGELARAMLQGSPRADGTNIKGTVEEELWDIVYYVLAIANCYDIDLERWIPVKRAINNQKYETGIEFAPV
jgi:NTP pyrophosphatase (non-canonical NTP hydrolase)